MDGTQTNDMPDIGVQEGPSPWRNARTPPGCRVYAVGDIHGRADLLARLLAAIAADSRRRRPARSILIFLGDYIDRGGDSRGVLNILLDGLPPSFEPVFLRGNHEAMLLDCLHGFSDAELWLRNGGLNTLESYGVDWRSVWRSGDAFLKGMPHRHLIFLERLCACAILGDYFFSHAGVRPGTRLDQQSEHDLLWIRSEFLDHAGDFGKVVVHGHTPAPKAVDRSNRIGVDTRAWLTGRLTAVALEGDRRRFLWTCSSREEGGRRETPADVSPGGG